MAEVGSRASDRFTTLGMSVIQLRHGGRQQIRLFGHVLGDGMPHRRSEET
jgi:hypothetical protein